MTSIRVDRQYTENGNARQETIVWGEAWGAVDGIPLTGYEGLWIPLILDNIAGTNAADPYADLRPGVTLIGDPAVTVAGEAVDPASLPTPKNDVPPEVPPDVFGDELWRGEQAIVDDRPGMEGAY